MSFRLPLALALTAAPALAQLPTLRVDAAVPLLPRPYQLEHVLTSSPGHPYAILVDVGSGPQNFLGSTIHLSFSAALGILGSGVTSGVNVGFVGIPPNLPAGMPFYLQAIVLDAASPNGLFFASNPESTIPIAPSGSVIVERFDNAATEGFVGSFDDAVKGRLQGGPVRRRVHETTGPEGVPFFWGFTYPLNAPGGRTQMVFRPQDLGSNGDPETIVAVRWLPALQLIADSFSRIELRMGHTPVTPDYSIDPFASTPNFPDSGLSPTFSANLDPARPPVTVYDGPYSISLADQRPDGFVPYPAIQPFSYDGETSLLLDFFVPAQGATGGNTQAARLMSPSFPLPAARVVAEATPVLFDPHAVVSGSADNAMYHYQFEFVRYTTTAVSPWRVAHAGADYQQPYVAATVPPGSSYDLEFRGADDPSGTNATAWSTNIDTADGHAYLQYRVRFSADPRTSAVPSIDTMVLRFR